MLYAKTCAKKFVSDLGTPVAFAERGGEVLILCLHGMLGYKNGKLRHIHKKMKEITGLNVAEFIRNIRLEQAARLLKEQKLNISQVAYTVGFSNPAHFSTLFKKYFGLTPKEYAA